MGYKLVTKLHVEDVLEEGQLTLIDRPNSKVYDSRERGKVDVDLYGIEGELQIDDEGFVRSFSSNNPKRYMRYFANTLDHRFVDEQDEPYGGYYIWKKLQRYQELNSCILYSTTNISENKSEYFRDKVKCLSLPIREISISGIIWVLVDDTTEDEKPIVHELLNEYDFREINNDYMVECHFFQHFLMN